MCFTDCCCLPLSHSDAAKQLNNARLSVLQTQSDTMNNIVAEAGGVVSQISSGDVYSSLLEGLIEQVLNES